ncbi:DUF2752 domain-containing protein [Dokdonella sp.]|uniref:DUF2752 domain-containing protein n=1 Tax=Dokdonella sp. TaxID=2291710 RepID=UPI003C54D2D6
MTGLVTPVRPWLSVLSLTVSAFGVAVMLMLLDPFAAGSILPSCPFHALTGLFCPGCGTTRALHAVLHGSFLLAFSMNPLAVIALALMPILIWNTFNPGRMCMAPLSDARIWLPLVLAFFVLRNLPWEPFVYLAPG